MSDILPHEVQIHNYHLDGYGHVNNARYLEFLEAARWDYFQQLGWRAILRQLQLVVVHVDIAYRRAATHDDILLIDTKMVSVQARQLILQQNLRLSGSLKTVAQAKVTLMPTQNGRAFRLPENLLDELKKYEETA